MKQVEICLKKLRKGSEKIVLMSSEEVVLIVKELT